MLKSDRVYIIAEAGVNHNGSLTIAKNLIDAAVDAGADSVKFQTFKADKLVSREAPKAAYQKNTTGGGETQFDMLKKLELSERMHQELYAYCLSRGIEFLSTPFDGESVDFLAGTLKLKRLKISSGEITNAPLLLKIARTGLPVILSTGMSTLSEIEQALGVLAFGYLNGEKPSRGAFIEAFGSMKGQKALKDKVVLLHCTSEYPAPLEEVNLRVIDTMRDSFGLPVGYSDHTEGIAIPIAAVARGSVIIEKHFTINRDLPGPDQKSSLEPDEFKIMVASIRQVEKALGTHLKAPVSSEIKNMDIVRKSLVAAKAIKKGDQFSEDNLTFKRPGTGVSPIHFWEWLGKTALKDYKEDEMVRE